MPINKFLGEIKRKKGVVSKNLIREGVERVTETSYRKGEKEIGGKLSKESIRKEVLKSGKKADKLKKTKKKEVEIKEKALKDAGTSKATYKKNGGGIIRRIAGKLFKRYALYLLVDGVGVAIQEDEAWEDNKRANSEKEEKTKTRECKLAVFLKQTEEKIEEIGTFCTWERVGKFSNILQGILIKIYSKIYPVVIISDGAKWIRQLRRRIRVLKYAKWILDWFHLKDHLEKMLRTMQIEEGNKIWEELIEHFWNGETGMALKKINEIKLSRKKKDREKEQEAREEFVTYVNNQIEGIVNYKEYKEKGYLIGSGYIEKRNDVMIKQRMVRGHRIRWGKKGGEAMMALLTAKYNDRMDEVFA